MQPILKKGSARKVDRNDLATNLVNEATVSNLGRLLQILINNFADKKYLAKLAKHEGEEIQLAFPTIPTEKNTLTFVLSNAPSDPSLKPSDNPKATIVFNADYEKLIPMLIDVVTSKFNIFGILKIAFKYILTRKIKFSGSLGALVATLKCFMTGNHPMVKKNKKVEGLA